MLLHDEEDDGYQAMKSFDSVQRKLMKLIRSNPRGSLWLSSTERKLETLRMTEQAEKGAEAAERFAFKCIAGACGIWLGSLLLYITVERQPLYVVAGLAISIGFLLMQIRALDRLLELRKRTILLELPNLMNRIAMLVDAGESVQQAIVRCADSTGHRGEDSVLQRELIHSMRQFRQGGETFASAMEGLARRCSVQEVTHFTTIVLLHYRRGGGDFVHTLRGAMRELWEKRKQVVRTIGEEASSKLIFPMMGIFLLIMIITAYPAIRMMG
jgi:tight adherence protein C